MGSDFLVTTPSFWAGVARLVDLFGELDDYNYAPNTEMADAIAVRVDWQAVGCDLQTAIHQYRSETHPDQLPLFDEATQVAASR